MVEKWAEQIAVMIGGNMWFAPFLALLGGILTSITPCALSNIPLIIGYVGGTGEKNSKKAFGFSVVFALGTAVMFTFFGIMAVTVGELIEISTRGWNFILAVLMLLMAVQLLGIFNFMPHIHFELSSDKKGFAGAFLAGIVGGVFSSHCAAPVLIALLAIAASEGSMLWGIFLMLIYAVGHSILPVAAGTSIGFVRKMNESTGYRKAADILRIVMGIILILIGVYMFYLAFAYGETGAHIHG